MVDRVEGPRPTPGFSNTPPPPPPAAEYNAITALWGMFHNDQSSTPVANTPHFWTMLAAAVNSVMAQFSTPPTDEPSLALYNDLTKTLFTAGGTQYSLASICKEPSANLIADLSQDYAEEPSLIAPVLSDLEKNIDNWYYNYTQQGWPVPKPTPPAEFQQEFTKFVADLQAVWSDFPGSPTWNTNLQNLVNDLAGSSASSVASVGIIGTLQAAEAAGTLDGYGQLMLNYFNSAFTANGLTSLASLVDAIKTAGGVATDPTDAATLGQWLKQPPALPSPFDPQKPMGSDLASWVDAILNKWEFPPTS